MVISRTMIEEIEPYLDRLRKKGIYPIVEILDGILTIRLKGDIEWINSDGTTTILEEYCKVGNIDLLKEQCEWYLDNYKKYTNFV